MQVFHSVKDDAHLERVAHLILLSSRLHNAAVEGALVPLVKKLSEGGGEMAQEMSKGLAEVEATAAKIDKVSLGARLVLVESTFPSSRCCSAAGTAPR